MKQPNLSILLQVNELLESITKMQNQVAHEQSLLADEKAIFAKQLAQEEARINQKRIQQASLQYFENQVAHLNESENQIREEIRVKVDKALSHFFNQGHFKTFVSTLIARASEHGQRVQIVAGADVKEYLETNDDVVQGQPGELRIVSGTKTYILDPQKVWEKLAQTLVEDLLSQK